MTLAVVEGGVGDWMRQPGLKWVWTPTRGGDDKLNATALQNVLTMLEHHPTVRGMFQHDTWKDALLINRGLPGDKRRGYPREMTDADEVGVAAWLSTQRLSAKVGTVGDIVREIAIRHPVNPMEDWIESLQWDWAPRIDTWLTEFAGVEDTPYTRLVSRRFMVGAMARARNPGCKCDTMLVLEGPQGLKKSSLVRELCGETYFSDQLGDITSKDGSQLIQGYWVIEVPEMDKLSRHESNVVKEFISRQHDRYRPPYGRNVVTRGRRCVMVGTLNPNGVGYIKDPTGGRRYWPVVCTKIDVEGLKAVRDQLWAEARSAYETGEKWWVDADEAHIVRGAQDERIDEDVWEPKVAEWLMTADDEFTSAMVLSGLGLEPKFQANREKNRVALILKKMGCTQRLSRRFGQPARVWTKPEDK